MKTVSMIVALLIVHPARGATRVDCLSGNFTVCKEIINKYGNTTDKTGAAQFFASVCSSENLNITCDIISVNKSETLQKLLKMANSDSAMFVIDGSKLDKIYRISGPPSPVPSHAGDKIDHVTSPGEAMSLYNEIKKQPKIANMQIIMKKYPLVTPMKFLEDISLKPIQGYPSEKNLFRVTKVATGSVYEKEGIKVGDLIRGQ